MASFFKNVVLIKAEVDFFDASFFEANIPLCSLGAMIKDYVHSVSMPIDMRIDPNALRHFEEVLAKMTRAGTPCDLVAISTMTASFPNAMKLARIAKKFGSYVVVGGYHPSALPKQMFDVGEIDAVVRGEGEITFQQFVLHGPSPDVQGLSYRNKNGEIHHNPDREKIADLDQLPFPDRRLRPKNPIFRRHEVIVTSRGCNGACTFCANGSVHGRWRGRSAENVVEELEQLYATNPKLTVHIWDANFMQDGDRVAKIIALVNAKDIHFRYFCEMRVDHITSHPDLIKGLADIGMEWIAIGIESPNQDRLKRLKKGITTTAVEQAIRILKENQIKIVGYLMIGDPEETADQMREYPAYAHQLGINKVLIAIQTPHPGSQFFADMEAQGGITSYDWEKYDIGHSVARLQHMTNPECEELMDWCWGKFYTPDWAIAQFTTLKASVYNYLVFAWFGYPGYLIRARPKEHVESSLKAYFSAMEGFYDLSGYAWEDRSYLSGLKGTAFQFTVQFRDGDQLSILTRINDQEKPVVEIYKGKRVDVPIDFTIKVEDFILAHLALPVQTASLIHWAGFNFKNMKANLDVLSILTNLLARSFQVKSLTWKLIPQILALFAKFLPHRWLDLFLEDIRDGKGQNPQLPAKEKEYGSTQDMVEKIMDSGKKVLYKLLLFPYSSILPVD